ncbi:gliding motility-associated C-terminal domain-containing protein [Pseudopedobacter beijingensis]|uniref:Gliding motility-associated C-terminal domain-containing protein n=1 Tax=Pseudopedobacter beijingensis TaxID=1207056 RepID=A0ABW4IF47_9SPHI
MNSTAPGIVCKGGDIPATEGYAFLRADATSPYNMDPKANGSGYLRLTNNKQYQKGYIYNEDIVIPSQNGLKIEFEYYIWGGNGADGICFFLYDADVTPNFRIGGFGGSLGYAQYKKNDLPTGPVEADGVTGGYLGVGIDVYGYFARTYEGRQPFLDGTEVNARQMGSIAIRGKGNGFDLANGKNPFVAGNYPLLAYKQTSSLSSPFTLVGPNNDPDISGANQKTNYGYRKAQILLERNANGGFDITVNILQGDPSGTLKVHKVIEKFSYNELAPERLAYGLSAASGQSYNNHDIRNLSIELLADKPIGYADYEKTHTNVPKDINVLQNDPSKTVPGIIVIADTNPAHGTATVKDEHTGIMTYTPNPGFSGRDQFTYKLQDQNKISNPITVTVDVFPIGSPDYAQTAINTPKQIDVKDNDLSKTGTSVVISTPPANGNVTVDPVTNIVTYTPNPNFEGKDTFYYILKTPDGLDSDPILVEVDVKKSVAPLYPAKIGLAKALVKVEKNVDGSFTLYFTFTAVNIGQVTADQLTLTDDLATVFALANYSVKRVTATGSLIANPTFNGNSDKNLLNPGSVLGPSSKEFVYLEVIVSINRDEEYFENYALLQGKSTDDGSPVEDESIDGFAPDPYAPGVKTPFKLKKGGIFVPEGFSPNGDGINDTFVIENSAGYTIDLEVYNRWGNIVYKSKSYQNDWAGKCNEGLYIGQDVPTGTYYYVVKINNEKKVGFITINR